MKIGLLTSLGVTLDAFFLEIVARWKDAGHEVFPAAGTSAEKLDSEVLRGVTRNPAPSNVMAPASLRRWVTDHNLDVVVTNTATVSLLVRLVPVGAPVVYFCHGLHWSELPALGDKVWQALEKAALRRTAGVLVLNTFDEDWFEREAPHLPITRLNGGVGLDLERFAPQPLPDYGHDESLLWIGEFSHRKRPMDALSVVKRLVAAGRSPLLTMLGTGALLEQCRTEIERRGLGDYVVLAGRQDPVPYLAASTAVLHTSAWEGLARALLEAVSVGRPVVGYDVKGVRDIPGSVICPLGDTAALAAAIDGLWARRDSNGWDEPRRREDLSDEVAASALVEFCAAVVELAQYRTDSSCLAGRARALLAGRQSVTAQKNEELM